MQLVTFEDAIKDKLAIQKDHAEFRMGEEVQLRVAARLLRDFAGNHIAILLESKWVVLQEVEEFAWTSEHKNAGFPVGEPGRLFRDGDYPMFIWRNQSTGMLFGEIVLPEAHYLSRVPTSRETGADDSLTVEECAALAVHGGVFAFDDVSRILPRSFYSIASRYMNRRALSFACGAMGDAVPAFVRNDPRTGGMPQSNRAVYRGVCFVQAELQRIEGALRKLDADAREEIVERVSGASFKPTVEVFVRDADASDADEILR